MHIYFIIYWECYSDSYLTYPKIQIHFYYCFLVKLTGTKLYHNLPVLLISYMGIPPGANPKKKKTNQTTPNPNQLLSLFQSIKHTVLYTINYIHQWRNKCHELNFDIKEDACKRSLHRKAVNYFFSGFRFF